MNIRVNHSKLNVWYIEHPLNENINIAKSVGKWNVHLIKQEMNRVCNLFATQQTWDIICTKISQPSLESHNDPTFKCNCLIMRNLRYDVSKPFLKRLISRTVKPISVIMSQMNSGSHLGKAIVGFATPHDAHRVMAELNGTLLKGRPVIIRFAPVETVDTKSNNDETITNFDNDNNKTILKPIYFNIKKVKVIGKPKMNISNKVKQNPLEKTINKMKKNLKNSKQSNPKNKKLGTVSNNKTENNLLYYGGALLD